MCRTAFLPLLLAAFAVAYHTHCLMERCVAPTGASGIALDRPIDDPACQGEVLCAAQVSSGPMAQIATVPPVVDSIVVAPPARAARLAYVSAPRPVSARISLQSLYHTFLI